MPNARLLPTLLLVALLTGCRDSPSGPSAASALRAVSALATEAVAGDTTGVVLAVRAETQGGAPVGGVGVDWSGPDAVTLVPLASSTGVNGLAEARLLPSDTTGVYSITATSAAGAVVFTVTVVPLTEPPAQLDDTFLAVTAGEAHTCALGVSGLAYCWGLNLDGRLGTGTRQLRTRPTPVSGWLRFRSLHAGARHTCGVTAEGVVYCWGDASDGRLGILPADVSHDCGSPGAPLPCELEPRRAATELRFQTLSAGDVTCGVTAAGAAYCWGAASQNQLGGTVTESCAGAGGPLSCSAAPVPVAGGITWRSISTGLSRSCGVAEDGRAWCWGAPLLGLGHTGGSATPAQVARVPAFDAIDVGALGCGTVSGAAWCWGLGYLGQLGTDEDLDSCTLFNAAVDCALAPVRVAGPSAWTAVVVAPALNATAGHACALDASGAASCWGSNSSGQLGAAAPDVCTAPNGAPISCARQPLPVAGNLQLTSLSAGADHTCGLAVGGEIYCWGFNFFGQLGDGSRVGRPTPVPVAPAEPL